MAYVCEDILGENVPGSYFGSEPAIGYCFLTCRWLLCETTDFTCYVNYKVLLKFIKNDTKGITGIHSASEES